MPPAVLPARVLEPNAPIVERETRGGRGVREDPADYLNGVLRGIFPAANVVVLHPPIDRLFADAELLGDLVAVVIRVIARDAEDIVAGDGTAVAAAGVFG